MGHVSVVLGILSISMVTMRDSPSPAECDAPSKLPNVEEHSIGAIIAWRQGAVPLVVDTKDWPQFELKM